MASSNKVEKITTPITHARPIPWNEVARLMLTSRAIDEIEEQELVPKGKITYQFSSKGHELVQVLLGLELDHAHDGATVYYRSRPFMLANGFTPLEAFTADMAKTNSPSEGRDVGVVYSMLPRGGATILPASGAVGAQYTPAVGWAQAIQYYQQVLQDNSWKGAIAVALGGDGSVATNGFWSALTIATTLNLPMLFSIEDNGFGISVPRDFQTPGGNIAENLASFSNLKILQGSGTDPEEAARIIHEAVAYTRGGTGPCLMRLDVPRLTGHTFGEDQTAYKPEDMIREENSRDPFIKLEQFLDGQMDWGKLKDEIQLSVRQQLEEALNTPDPDVSQALVHLFYSKPTHPDDQEHYLSPSQDGPRINFSEAVRKVMDTELENNPRLLIFGQDVGVRGGVHRVTLGLQAKHGELRVADTSLSEEGIIGRSVGLALAGLRPLPEIQFRKYADPATEQINDIGWLRWRTAGKFSAPIVVRIPVGYSKRTGDPWHSVSGEAIYAHTLGWRIAFPSNAADAAGLLRMALREQDPTFFLEHRALLDTPPGRKPYPGDDYLLPFGRGSIIQKGSELTVVTWGEMVHRCKIATSPFGGSVEIIDLRTIIPWDKEIILNSIAKTSKCLVVHEDTYTAGFAGEIIATIADEAFKDLDAPLRRLTTPDVPIPYNIPMMNSLIPSIEKIQTEIERLLSW